MRVLLQLVNCVLLMLLLDKVSDYTRSFHDNIPNEETIHNINYISRTVKYLEDMAQF